MEHRQKGQTLAEIIITASMIGCMAAIGLPALTKARNGIALAAATSQLRSVFQQTRMMAIARNRSLGIRFQLEPSSWSWRVYEDGDGDGVRNDDISKGVDFPVEPRSRLQVAPGRIGIPDGKIPDPYAPQPLAARPPVRFGTGYLCVFTSEGDATNGSIVVTDGQAVRVLRVYGTSAVVSMLRWDGKKWVTGV